MPAVSTQNFSMQQKRAAASSWTGVILQNGEFGYDTTNKIVKIGDGVTPWESLPSISSGGSSAFGQIDGGGPTSNYGGTTPIDGGGV